MQEQKFNGEEKLTDQITHETKEFIDAMSNVKNRVVALHKPGSVIKQNDGTLMVVNTNGEWHKITQKYLQELFNKHKIF